MANDSKLELVGMRHPEYVADHSDWEKWRLAYQGGSDFKEAYLFKYSKREEPEDFTNRSKLTYVPGHARSVINIIRNAIAAKLPEVKREGNEIYLDMMKTNVDLRQSSMNTFVALEIVPLMLVQGKQYVVIDAPPARPGATLAEDDSRPFLFTVGAEDVLSWNFDGNTGKLTAILMRLHEDVIDPATGLVTATAECFRYMRYVPEGASIEVHGMEGAQAVSGPGVFVRTCNAKEEDVEPQRFLPLSGIPVVEFRLSQSIMGEIADHQIALLNLSSTDTDFLWRGNFPLYTEQAAKGTDSIKPRGSKAKSAAGDEGNSSDENEKRRRVAIAKGVRWPEGLERPDFIAPPTANLLASMEKQQAITQEIRVLVDLALTSISVKALEQSGKSKLADRVGQEAGLAHIGTVLETGEREVAIGIHEFLGDKTTKPVVNYPGAYSVKTQEERLEEAKQLEEVRTATRSPAYQKEVDKRTAEVILTPLVSSEKLTEILAEIDALPHYDDDTERAAIIQSDVQVGLVDTATGSQLRGLPEGSAAKAEAERVARVEATAAKALGESSRRVPIEDDDDFDPASNIE